VGGGGGGGGWGGVGGGGVGGGGWGAKSQKKKKKKPKGRGAKSSQQSGLGQKRHLVFPATSRQRCASGWGAPHDDRRTEKADASPAMGAGVVRC